MAPDAAPARAGPWLLSALLAGCCTLTMYSVTGVPLACGQAQDSLKDEGVMADAAGA